MSKRFNIALWGASGVMGRHVIASVEASRAQYGGAVAVGFVGESDAYFGKKLDGVSRPLLSKWSDDIQDVDVIIDFSTAAGSISAISAARAAKLPIIVCATGHSQQQIDQIEAAASDVAVIRARNTSIGVNAALKLVAEATKLLGPAADIEISEIHHTRKKDAPSGTAKALGDAVAHARGVKLAEVEVAGRAGDELSYRKGEIGMSAIRGGDIVGEHTVYFFLENERIEITHRSMNRRIYADGAVQAAKWLVGREAGLYSMFDVIGSEL